ncbi:MAG: hypothetical protein H0X46_04120 [Bacteroidetes bacterium]|nr:hypothetical protein [Bacteroidota bacterium]
MYLFKLFILFTFLLCLGDTGSAQEAVDTIAEKKELAAVNTDPGDVRDSVNAAKYKKVDDFVLNMKKRNKPIPGLAKEITAPFSTEEEKARAIFIWMTNNIAFDCVTYHTKKTPEGDFSYKTPEELIVKLDKYYYKYAMLVLRNKKGVAEGYSVLFRELCKAAGLNCQLVEGKASENKDKIKKFRNRKSFNTNHTWNKVQINGNWYYLDVTWASGYCDKPVKRFYKKFNPHYFFSSMDNLYDTHAENVRFTERRNNPTGE